MRYRGIIAAAAVCCLFSSCGLLPAEEELPASPVLADYEAKAYQTAAAARGDLRKTETVSCTYKPARTASLSFAIGGEQLKTLYVREGDMVEAGQLLAELDQGDLASNIAVAENALRLGKLEVSQLDEQWALEERRLQYKLERLSQTPHLLVSQIKEQAAELQKDFSEQKQEYENKRRELTDGMAIQEQTLAELSAKAEKRQLRAPFSGVVTYARPLEDGEAVQGGQTLVRLSDAAVSVFVVEDEKDFSYFTEGEQLEVVCSEESYPVEVASPSAVGAEEEKAAVYLRLLTEAKPDADSSGTVTFVLDERKDALLLPSKAVFSVEGRRIVYYIDENGLRAEKDVETGLDNGVSVEIVSGLSEGEEVLLNGDR